MDEKGNLLAFWNAFNETSGCTDSYISTKLWFEALRALSSEGGWQVALELMTSTFLQMGTIAEQHGRLTN